MKLHEKAKAFKEKKSDRIIRKKYKKPVIYTMPDGDIEVVLWARWPSYDFIFGVPAKTHKLYGVEFGFFQHRDTRHKKINEGFYLDKGELESMVEGFTALLKLSNNERK